MCVFSQTRVKALGGGLESEKGGLGKIMNRLPGHEMSHNVHLFGEFIEQRASSSHTSLLKNTLSCV